MSLLIIKERLMFELKVKFKCRRYENIQLFVLSLFGICCRNLKPLKSLSLCLTIAPHNSGWHGLRYIYLYPLSNPAQSEMYI